MKNNFPATNQNYQYYQSNRSNVLGSLWSTMGIDLQSNLGVARLSPRLRINTAGVANQGRAVAFRYVDNRWFAICGGRVFKNSSPSLLSPFIEDTSTGFITTYSADQSDLEFFNNELWATAQDKLMRKALNTTGTGAWSVSTLLTGDAGHKLLYFKRLNRLYYFDQNKRIHSVASTGAVSTSGDYTIDLGDYTKGVLSTMVADSQNIWVATKHTVPASISNNVLGCSIFLWDGISAQFSEEYPINASGILAMAFDNKRQLHAFDSNGAILAFTGSGFEEVGRLPLNRQLLLLSANIEYNSFVHPNGMVYTRNNTFMVLVNNTVEDNTLSIVENLPSGIWEWSKETGFVHRQAVTYNNLSNTTITDYGQNRISNVGALVEANFPTTDTAGKATLICGVDYYTNGINTLASGIFVDDPMNTIQKKGYMVTTWFSSNEIENTWDKFWATYRRLLSATDTIDVKYRSIEESPIEVAITWVNTTSFTTTTDVTAYAPTASGFNGTIGGEVEITQGTGGASTAHITSVVNNAGTYTVTLDTAIVGVTTGTAKARFQKWIKCYPAKDISQVKSYSQWGIASTETRVQIKICFTFTGDGEFYKSIIISNEDIKALG